MAFDDILARDPKSEEEFWTIIKETFEQVQGVLATYQVETRDEALEGTLRRGNYKDASLSFIRYRGVRDTGGDMIAFAAERRLYSNWKTLF